MKSKLMSSIHGIDVPSNLRDKEIDAEKLALNQNLPTESKLPFSREATLNQSSKKKKHKKNKKNKKGEDSSGGSSEEYTSGNNSGTDSGNEERTES